MRFSREEILRAIRDPQYKPGVQGAPVSFPVSGGYSASAVVGAYGHVAFRPSRKVVLEVRSLLLINTAAQQTYYIRTMKQNDLASLAGLAALFGPTPLSYMQGPSPVASTARSTVESATSTAGAAGAAITPAVLFAATIANEDKFYTLPDPVVLFGDDPTGLPALVVAHTVVNVSMNALIVGREWPFDTDDY